jgi:hypothetical protein
MIQLKISFLENCSFYSRSCGSIAAIWHLTIKRVMFSKMDEGKPFWQTRSFEGRGEV